MTTDPIVQPVQYVNAATSGRIIENVMIVGERPDGLSRFVGLTIIDGIQNGHRVQKELPFAIDATDLADAFARFKAFEREAVEAFVAEHNKPRLVMPAGKVH